MSKKIKVVIVQPPSEGCVKSFLTQVDEDAGSIGFKPPLGILYIGTYLQNSFGDTIDLVIIDCIAERLNIEQSVKKIAKLTPDIVGISAWTDFWYPSFTLGKQLKELNPNTKIVYGGPHVSIYPHITLECAHTDAIVAGDGEEPFRNYVAHIAQNEPLKEQSGIYLKKDLNENQSYPLYIEKDLDKLSTPNRELLPLKNYSSILFKEKYSSTMITSRGCPYKCTFCKLNFQKTLSRSAQNVVEEFAYLESLGIKEVEVYDDTFTWSKKRVREICEGILERNIKIHWAIRDRVSSYDPELIHLMKKAGCNRIHYGIESGVQHVIDRMKKKITVEEATIAVKGAKKAGMTVLAFFMFGNIDETKEDMEETIKYALSIPADYATFSVTMPYAGTEMYEESLKNGTITYDFWKQYAKNPEPNFEIPEIIETACTKEEIINLAIKGEKQFYFRPKYILRELMTIKDFKHFYTKFKLALKMFLKK